MSERARSFLESIRNYDKKRPTPGVRLATVAGTDDGLGNVRVTFDGESVVSGRAYPYLGVRPGAGARVVMLRQGRGWFVLGVISSSSRPAGVIEAWGGIAAPAGALFCRGQAVSRTTYAGLYAAIGTKYGVGDGSSTFNVPDGRKRALVGLDSSESAFDDVGKTGGAETHSHGLNGTGWALMDLAGGATSKLFMKRTTGGGVPSWTADGNIAGTVSGTAGGNETEGVDLGGATNAAASRDPFLVVNWIIWA